jgi:hypothetical protein
MNDFSTLFGKGKSGAEKSSLNNEDRFLSYPKLVFSFSVSTNVSLNSEYSYIHQGRVAHRHKFPSRQSELLVGYRHDEAHRALKLDRSANPFHSPGSIFYTFSLQ